jgi:hypothetical protein
MTTGKHIIELQNQLQNSAEHKRIGQIMRLSFTLRIFSINAAELKRRMEYARSPQVAFKLGGNQFLFDQYFLDMMRLLHNFVAASMTLIDHARQLYDNNYADHPSFREYNQEIKTRFATDPLCKFVQDLRNYTLHWEIPLIGSKISVIPEKHMEHTMYLNRDQLMRWVKWTAPARIFLESSSQKIDLYAILSEYEMKIRAFYDWYYERLREVHEKDIMYVEAKQTELLRLKGLELPRHLEVELDRHQTSRIHPEDMFNGYVNPETLYRLIRSDTEARERAKVLLDQVSKYSTVPEKLQQRVIDAFVEYYRTSHK